MSDDALPEPDRVDGAPHPRDTPRLIGQDAAQQEFLEAFNSERLHHGWMITGPRGSGKATLAWSIARFLLATPLPETGGMFGDSAPVHADTLAIAPDHPVVRRMAAGSEQGLFVLRRGYNDKTKRLKDQITVDEARKLKGFFSLSSADGGRRVVIVDAADELNTSAANALLKLLEEPPARTTLLLVTHQPSGLLPTIRSRCRVLRLKPLEPDQMQQALDQAGVQVEAPDRLAALAEGSVGAAVRLANLNGLALYAEWIGILGSLPRLDRTRAQALAEAAAMRGAEERRALMVALLDQALGRLAKTGATGQPPAPQAARDEAEVLMRLAPGPDAARLWAAQAQEIGARLRHGLAVNLDPAALILDTVFRLQKAAAGG
ncbi:DNA polymerase III subunit delta' [Pseudooceanicola sediminis]|uniref:DNA polymerase III subunit delta n=1 Tax=Pseudooceanicola sediminis TaxID=2211117 RepID=A0A399J2Z8_9RHOB|nr:DNA polymerase III subunit delta' [Pseudooceanicola sediminis]KAA2315161.1 DNA polymerase III subunit delta' [Puniceibacterium sp. HSS470]RII39017.1 DNA polymerase III subunit delta' [Pseudooceanicola sediminis]|tara:strand:+ start:8015 stop:9142 length:1128 start_codon:yes stop_codon:yes gene_type:complete